MKIKYLLWMLVFALISNHVYSTDIDSCNSSWFEENNTIYNITNNINLNSDTLCLKFRNSENITLNCNNHWLNGTNNDLLDYGIYAQYVNNITIINCSMKNWTYGIYLYQTNNSILKNSYLYQNNKTIKLKYSYNNFIYNLSIIDNNEFSLAQEDSSNNTFQNITITSSIDNHTGIQFSKAYNNIFSNININSTGSDSKGVVFSNSSNNVFYDSFFNNNDSDIYNKIRELDGGFSNNTFVNVSLNESKIFFQNEGYFDYITSHVDLIYYMTLNFTGYNLLDVNYLLVSTDVLARNNITETNIDSSVSYIHNYTFATVFFNGINYANNFSINSSAINFSDYSGSKTLDKNDYITISMKLVDEQECNYSNTNCYSTFCKEDYDSTGSWCAQSNECAHDNTIYSGGNFSADCYNITARARCGGSGTWNYPACNYYQCDSGACYINCTNTSNYCQNQYFCIDNGVNGVCANCDSYDNQHCSVSSNNYLSDGFCAYNTSTWSCDNSYIALATNGDYYNQCYASIQGTNCNAGSISGAYSAAGLCVNTAQCVQGIISYDQTNYYENCSASNTSLIYTCMDYLNENNFTATGICAHNSTDYECIINTTIYNNSGQIYQGCSDGEGNACSQNQTFITSIFTPDGICTLNNICTGFNSEISYNGSYIDGCIDNSTQCDSNLTSTIFIPDGLCFMSGCLVNGEQTLNEVCANTSSCTAGINLTCYQYYCLGYIGYFGCSDNSDCAGDLKCHENICEANTPPNITITSQNTVYNTDTVNITFNITDRTDSIFNCTIILQNATNNLSKNIYNLNQSTIYNATFENLAQSLQYHTHNYWINCTDGLNNTIISSTLYINDTIPPSVTFTAPENNTVNNSYYYNLTLNATFSDTNIYNYTFYLNSTEIKTDNLSSDSITYPLDAYGAYTWHITAIDEFGNINDTGVYIINKVNIPPNITSITINTTDNNNYTNATFTASFTASDDFNQTYAQNNYQVRWYNGTTLTITSLTLNTSYTKKHENWTVSIRTNDSYNWSDWTNKTITINNAPPSAPEIIYPINNSIHNNNSIIIECGNSIDIDNDTINYIIFSDNQTDPQTIITSPITSQDKTYYYAKCIATDTFKNSSYSDIITFYESHKPNITAKNTKSAVNLEKQFNFTVTDIMFNVSVYFNITKNNSLEYSHTINNTENATIYFNYTFTDIAVYTIHIIANNSYKTAGSNFTVNSTAGCGAVINNSVASSIIQIDTSQVCSQNNYYIKLQKDNTEIYCNDFPAATNTAFIINANNAVINNCNFSNFNNTLNLSGSQNITFFNISIINSTTSITYENLSGLVFSKSFLYLNQNLTINDLTLLDSDFIFDDTYGLTANSSLIIKNSTINSTGTGFLNINDYLEIYNSSIGIIKNQTLKLNSILFRINIIKETLAVNISNCSDNSILKNIEIKNLTISNCNNINLSTLTLNSGVGYGIKLINSGNNTISKSLINGYDSGIVLQNSSYNKFYSLILNNTNSIIFNSTINNSIYDAFFYTSNLSSEIIYHKNLTNINFLINYSYDNKTHFNIYSEIPVNNQSKIIYKQWMIINAVSPSAINVDIRNYYPLNNITIDNLDDYEINNYARIPISYLIQDFDNITDFETGQYIVTASADGYYDGTEYPQLPFNNIAYFTLNTISSGSGDDDDEPSYTQGEPAPEIIIEPEDAVGDNNTGSGTSSNETSPETNLEDLEHDASTESPATVEEENIEKFANNIYEKSWYEHIENDTQIYYEIENNGIVKFDTLAVIINISKDICQNTSLLKGSFSILEDDPVIFFLYYNVSPKKRINFHFDIINKTLSDNDFSRISYKIITKISDEDLKRLTEQAKLTKEVASTSTKATVIGNKTLITTSINTENNLENVTIYLEIPKCLAETIVEIEFEMEDFEVIKDDPLIAFSFASIDKRKDINFKVLKEIDPDCWEQIKMLPIAQRIGDKIIVNNEKKLYFILGIIIAINLFVLGFNFIQKKTFKSDSKSIFHKIEFGIIETIFVAIIILNIMDFVNLLTPDLDFAKKILSWAILGFLLYEVNLEEVFYGKKNIVQMLVLLLANFLLMSRVFMDYVFIAYTEIVEKHLQSNVIQLYQNIINIELAHPGIITSVSFFVGFQIILILAFIDMFKDIKSPSLFAVLHIEGKPQKFKDYIKRFLISLFIYLTFYIIFFSFFMEWLAISVDATIMVLGILFYSIRFIMKHAHHYHEKHIIRKIGNVGEDFYQQFISFFKYKYTIMFGLVGILVLHLLVDIGNYIIPFLINMKDVLYFSQIDSAHLSLYVILKNIYTQNIFQNILITSNYLLNTIFVVFCLVFPGYLWYDIYKNHTINITRPWLSLFFASAVNYMMQPLIWIQSIEAKNILGVDILFNSTGDFTNVLKVFGVSIFMGIFVYYISRHYFSRTLLNYMGAILIQIFFSFYVYYYLKSWIFSLYPQIISFLSIHRFSTIFLGIFFMIILLITSLFYIVSYIYFIKLVYSEWFIKKHKTAYILESYKHIIKKYDYSKNQQIMLVKIIKNINILKKRGISDLIIEEKLYEKNISEDLIKDIIYL